MVDGCRGWTVAARAEILPCAILEIGAMRGAGQDVTNPQQVTNLWLAPGAGARLRWPSEAGYFVEATAAAVVPLVRDRYYIAPSTTAFEVQPVNVRAGVSVGLTIW